MQSMAICQRYSKIACNFCAVAMEPWSLPSYLAICVHRVIVPQHALSSCLGRGYSSGVRSERINIVILINEAKRKVTCSYTLFVRIEARASISFQRYLTQPLFEPGFNSSPASIKNLKLPDFLSDT